MPEIPSFGPEPAPAVTEAPLVARPAEGEQPSEPKQLSPDRARKTREQILLTLVKARLLPESWASGDGRTRDQVIAALEEAHAELGEHVDTQAAPAPLVAPPQPDGAHERPAQPDPLVEPLTPSVAQAPEAQPKADEAGRYLTIGGAHIPVCAPPRESASWEAVPGSVTVSGGGKFSNVRFVKTKRGLTHTAKPGELLAFSEAHRNERLETVDTVLEGTKEVRAFNEITKALAQSEADYRELDPDDPDYDSNATKLAARIDQFTSAKGIVDAMGLEQDGLGDPESFAERAAAIITTMQFLRSIDNDANEFVPEQDPHFKLPPYMEKQFGLFATLANRQLGLGNNAYLEELMADDRAPEWEKLSAKGMTVIVGPRGTGKNKLVDHYAALTNRPLFRYACSPNKEERDLTYDVELSDGEVVRIPTRILTAVTTPNAVLELDELNLLPPNVAKFFNSLFDGDRTIFLNDQVIKAAPGTLFVGLMNPAEYDGVGDLPETIDDRSNVMRLGYPPLREIDPVTNQERFTHDEALILKEHITPLKSLSDDQFVRAWDYVVNNRGDGVSLNTEAIKVFDDLRKMLTIADRTRKTVEAYHNRSGETRMERDISLRGSIEAVRYYSENHMWDTDVTKLPGYKPGYAAAQCAIAATYLPHTDTYRRGKVDREAMQLILAEQVR